MKRNKMIFYLLLATIFINGNSVIYGAENVSNNEFDKPSLLPMLPDDYLDLENRPVVLPMLPNDYLNLNESEHYINKEGYTVVKYDKNSLESTIQELGIEFPEKLKVEGSSRLTLNDWLYLNNNAVYLDLSLIRSEDDAIPIGAFENNKKLKRIKFPNHLKRIDDNAFFNCSTLEGGLNGDLEFPDKLSYIGEGAFSACISLKGNISLPDQITIIKTGVFSGCNELAGTLKLPTNLKEIEELAFGGCKFTGPLILPNTLEKIGNNAFEQCTNFTGDLIIPNNVKEIGIAAFKNCSGFNGDLILSDQLTIINNAVFENCTGLKGYLTLPKNLLQINANAFKKCSNLKGSIFFPEQLRSIGNNAFEGCIGFTGNLIFPNSLESIGSYAFLGCSGLNGELILPPKNILTSNNVFNNTMFKSIKNYSTLSNGNVISLNGILSNPQIFGFSSNTSFYNQAVSSHLNWNELSEQDHWENLIVTYDNRYNSLQEAIESQIPLHESYSDYGIRDWINKRVQIVTKDNKTLLVSDFEYLNQDHYLMNLDLSQAQLNENQLPDRAFYNNKHLLMIDFPKHLSKIGNDSFKDCNYFIGGEGYTLTLSPSIHRIGNNAFFNASGIQTIKNHYTPAQEVGENAFATAADHPQFAYGYSDNNIYKTHVELNNYKWKEFGIFIEGFDKEIVDGYSLKINDLYEAFYKNQEIIDAKINVDLNDLPLGENEIELTVTSSGLEETIIVNVNVKPNLSFYNVKKRDKIIKVGYPITLEELFKSNYKGKDLAYEDLIYKQTTNFDLENLKKGKHRIGIDVVYEGLKLSVSPTVTVKYSLFDEEENKPKIQKPMLDLNPSFVYKDYITLYPAIKHIPFEVLQPSLSIEKNEELVEEEPPIEDENTSFDQNKQDKDINHSIDNDFDSEPLSKDQIKDNQNSQSEEPFIDMVDILDTSIKLVPLETIREDAIIVNEQILDNNKDDHYENRNIILITSSLIFGVFIFILLLIIYINKKRKEDD